MRPRDSRNPRRLLVEGVDDLFTVVQLTRAHGVDWDSEGSGAPFIRDAGGFEGALRCYRARRMREKWARVSTQNDGEAPRCGRDSISKPDEEEGASGSSVRGPTRRVRVKPGARA
jgi:hypothetical protein